jgi:hypothetical protein
MMNISNWVTVSGDDEGATYEAANGGRRVGLRVKSKTGADADRNWVCGCLMQWALAAE